MRPNTPSGQYRNNKQFTEAPVIAESAVRESTSETSTPTPRVAQATSAPIAAPGTTTYLLLRTRNNNTSIAPTSVPTSQELSLAQAKPTATATIANNRSRTPNWRLVERRMLSDSDTTIVVSLNARIGSWVRVGLGSINLGWQGSRKLRRLGNIGIERLLRNFVLLGVEFLTEQTSKHEGAQQWLHHGTKRSENTSRLCT